MSASRRPTSAPLLRSAAARLTPTIDLPTPPLPDATAMVCLTPGRISDGLGRMNAGRTFAVMRTSTPVTPGISPTRSCACDLKRSRTGQAGVVRSKVKLTLPWSLTSSSLIMPSLTTSRPRSGSWMWARTPRTWSAVGTIVNACYRSRRANLRAPRTDSSGRARRTCRGPSHLPVAASLPRSLHTNRSPIYAGPVFFATLPVNFITTMKEATPQRATSELVDYFGGPASDIYFQRAHDTLAAAGIDAIVTMDYFSSGAGLACGVAEAVRLLGAVLKSGDEVSALAEGEAMAERETVLRVRAPYSRFGVYETALLGMLSSCTGWAAAAREVGGAAGGKRVMTFGASHVHPLIAPTMEYSAVVGGCAGCATPLGAQLAELQGASGTMPHSMILLFGDTVKAALAFDEHMGDDVLRIVLVDTFNDEAEESLRVAEALAKRLRCVRLDTPSERGGVTVDLVKEVRARLDLAGFDHVGIFVSGGLGAGRVRQVEAARGPIHSYGVGMG